MRLAVYSISKLAAISSVTLKNNLFVICQTNNSGIKIAILKEMNYILTDTTSSNHPELVFFNNMFYILHNMHDTVCVLKKILGPIITEAKSFSSAIVSERECYEMFGISFEQHPDNANYYWIIQ